MEGEKYIVYLHVNKTNGKVYVGITHHTNPELRWRCGYKNNPHFTSAIKKYGWNNFEHVVLFQKLPKEIACREEQLLIKRYRKKRRCYNISNGGEGTFAMSESTKEKLRRYKGPLSSQYGRKHSIERVNQQRIHALNCWKNITTEEAKSRLKGVKPYQYKSGNLHPNYRKTMSKEIRDKIRIGLSKPVFMIDKINNTIIREFTSAIEAERFLEKKGNHISDCCNGKRKSSYGYIWKYKEDTI